jgi:hypothetical protein
MKSYVIGLYQSTYWAAPASSAASILPPGVASAVIAAVTRSPQPNVARSADIRFRKASRPLVSQVAPQVFGSSRMRVSLSAELGVPMFLTWYSRS